MRYQIWMEGYLATGMEGIQAPAKFMGSMEANSFREACIKFSKTPDAKGFGNFSEQSLSYWGCGLYDNEADARASFG